MAYQVPGFRINIISGADLTTKKFRFVKVNADAKAVLAGADENAVGVLQDEAVLGEATNIMVSGITKVVAGGAVTAGSNISSDANGEAVTAGAGAILGIALESAGAGEMCTLLLVAKNSIAAAGKTVVQSILSIPVDLAKVAASGDLVTNYIPGIVGKIKKISFLCTEAGVGVNAAITFNMEVNAVNVTGGVVSLAVANTLLGAVLNGTDITADNTFVATDSISIKAVVATAFTSGKGCLVIVLEQ